jgi:hypothetical protein
MEAFFSGAILPRPDRQLDSGPMKEVTTCRYWSG